MAVPKSKKFRKTIVFTAIGIVLAGLTCFAVFKRREVAITVQVEKVTRRNITELVVANGKIQPVVQVMINPEVSGEIIELPVKEGQLVKKGDLLLRIKPDYYNANLNSAEASYKSALAAKSEAQAELDKAEFEFKRTEELFKTKLVSESVYLDVKTVYEVAKLRYQAAIHQTDMAMAARVRAEEDLMKTRIVAPMDGSVTKLKSQLGERVVGTAMMAGTEIMTIADLNEMEARVDIGEIDVVLIALGQKARLEVDAFRDRKFNGIVSEIANASKGSGQPGGGGGGRGDQQEATKFEVKIHISEKEVFRPGMSVMSEVETRYRTNVLAVPIQSVTTRIPKDDTAKRGQKAKSTAQSSLMEANANASLPSASESTNAVNSPRKSNEPPKPVEVVFLAKDGMAQMVKVKPGISDDSFYEIVEGLQEGQLVISGGYKAISRELEDGKKIKIGPVKSEAGKERKNSA
jgi:HlyD family secretion protein